MDECASSLELQPVSNRHMTHSLSSYALYKFQTLSGGCFKAIETLSERCTKISLFRAE